MELLKYLNDNFLTKQALLEISKVTQLALVEYQNAQLMPQPSYQLNIDASCTSFFGEHNENQKIEYYAKGYTSWLGIVQSLKTQDKIYSVFSSCYINTIDSLKAKGHSTTNSKLNSELRFHIEDEWKHFLNGTYGLCTKSGLPEDIAAKEFAIIEINELIIKDKLTDNELIKLTDAVNLLDEASAQFAPHERLKSSRYRYIDEVRRQYKLSS